MRKWTPRFLVLLCALLALGTATYFWQASMAKKVGHEMYLDWSANGPRAKQMSKDGLPYVVIGDQLAQWRLYPWFGIPGADTKHLWIPKRSFHVFFMKMTGKTLPNDPDAWEAWFKAHPDLIWDEKRKRLVETPPRILIDSGPGA